jgi:hypothetical protein
VFDGQIPRNDYLRFRWDRIMDMIGGRLFGATLDDSVDEARPPAATVTTQ